MKKRSINKPELIISIIIALICFVLVCTMSIQFKTVDEANVTDIENMREAELRTQISAWKTKYEETAEKLEENNNKIQEYSETIDNNQKTEDVLNKELKQTNLLAGKTDVKGEGIIITLKDSDESTITSNDLIELINELRYAGAEAISINDIRITANSYIATVNGSMIRIDLQRVSGPYIVKAIGNQTYLSSTLSLKDNGYIDKYKNSGKDVNIETEKNIQIAKKSTDMSTKYVMEVEDK